MAGVLTPSDWATICTLYQRSEKTMPELANQFGVSKQAIQQGLKQRGVTRESSLTDLGSDGDDTARKAVEAQRAQARTTRENYAQWVDVLSKMTMRKVVQAEQTRNLPSVNADLIVLKKAMEIIEKGRGEAWAILQLEELLGDTDELPDLNVGEYTPGELEAIREANEETYQSTLLDGEGDLDLNLDDD